jgi:hypothetical protein
MPLNTADPLTPEQRRQFDDYLTKIMDLKWGDIIVRVVDGRVRYILPVPSIPAAGTSGAAAGCVLFEW